MLQFIQTHPAGGDCTAPYTVILDRKYTFGELVDEILTKREWGYIRFSGFEYKYRGSECDEIPNEIRNLSICSVKASGGWSRMDYNVN